MVAAGGHCRPVDPCKPRGFLPFSLSLSLSLSLAASSLVKSNVGTSRGTSAPWPTAHFSSSSHPPPPLPPLPAPLFHLKLFTFLPRRYVIIDRGRTISDRSSGRGVKDLPMTGTERATRKHLCVVFHSTINPFDPWQDSEAISCNLRVEAQTFISTDARKRGRNEPCSSNWKTLRPYLAS